MIHPLRRGSDSTARAPTAARPPSPSALAVLRLIARLVLGQACTGAVIVGSARHIFRSSGRPRRAWAIDRLGRSLSDLLDTHLEACGVDLYLDQQAIDTTTPMDKLVFQLTGPFAEFERTMIRQRIKAGLKCAIAQGVKLGRPKIDSATERKVRNQLAKGVGILKVARSLGIGTGTVQRIAKEVG